MMTGRISNHSYRLMLELIKKTMEEKIPVFMNMRT